MTEFTLKSLEQGQVHGKLPHQKLIVWQRAVELLVVVRDARIGDAGLREQALRAVKSVCLNIAEVNGRQGVADRKRVFGIARGELAESMAAVEIASVTGECRPGAFEEAVSLGVQVHAMLTALINR